MKELKIKSLTNKGERALRTHLDEFKKMKLRQRLIFKTAGYSQKIIDNDPLSLLLMINNRHSRNPQFLDLITGEIKKALKKNGAEFNIDYEILDQDKEMKRF